MKPCVFVVCMVLGRDQIRSVMSGHNLKGNVMSSLDITNGGMNVLSNAWKWIFKSCQLSDRNLIVVKSKKIGS